MAVAAGLVTLLNGPWLRVTDITWGGERFTSERDLDRVLEEQRGRSVLAIDTREIGRRLERLPAVADATVSASLPGRIDVSIVERQAAFIWITSTSQLLGDADGTLFAAFAHDAELAPEQIELPRVTDERSAARLTTPGDAVPNALLAIALRLADVDPASLGSKATQLDVRLDDEFGFRVAAVEPGWEMALGVFGVDPSESLAAASARLERQVTAVRTLFASHPEAEISWVDVRNPGKVYFRAKG